MAVRPVATLRVSPCSSNRFSAILRLYNALGASWSDVSCERTFYWIGVNEMRVLVTGHLGYIGTVLTPMLVRAGHEVVGLDSDLYARCTFSHGGEIRQVPTIRKDTRDVELQDLIGFDAVLHLAALSNDPLGNLKPGLTDDIN